VRLASFKVRTEAPVPRRESSGRVGWVEAPVSETPASPIVGLDWPRWRSVGRLTKEGEGDGWRLGCNGGGICVFVLVLCPWFCAFSTLLS
jgi:hypothetical protein